jgi:hypothetical protein
MQDRQSLAATERNERIVDQSGPVGPVGGRDPEKSLEKLAHCALRQIARDENEPGAMIIVRPAFKSRGRVEYVLHTVHDNRRVRHFRKFHNAFDAQKLFSVRGSQQFEKHLQSSRWNGIVGYEYKGADMLVVPIDVVMMTVITVAVRVGFGGKPFLHVGDFPVRVIKPAPEQPLGRCFAFGSIEDGRGRV